MARRRIGTPGRSIQRNTAGTWLACNRCGAAVLTSRKCVGTHCRTPGCKGRLHRAGEQ